MTRAAQNPPTTQTASFATRKMLIGFAALLGLGACATGSNYAPVVYHHMSDPRSGPVVAAGDPSLAGDIPETLSANHHPSARAPLSQRPGSQRIQSEPLQTVSNESYAEPSYSYQSGPIAPVALRSVEGDEPAQTLAAAAAPGQIVVQPGETLFGVSRKYGVDRGEIIAANALTPPFALRAGQVLTLPQNTNYQVRPGDTLYSVSRQSGVPVQTIAAANNLSAPYTLSSGQVLKLPAGGTMVAGGGASDTAVGGPLVKPGAQPVPPAGKAKEAPKAPTGFAWPAKGQVITEFGPTAKGQRNDGINLRLPEGAAVRAARGGEVIYVGSEIANFGNLVLIRHENGYVTAYAHARRVYVQRGDVVERGQHIADVGRTGAVDEPQLHFEIRKDQKPVDPRKFLPSI